MTYATTIVLVILLSWSVDTWRCWRRRRNVCQYLSFDRISHVSGVSKATISFTAQYAGRLADTKKAVLSMRFRYREPRSGLLYALGVWPSTLPASVIENSVASKIIECNRLASEPDRVTGGRSC